MGIYDLPTIVWKASPTFNAGREGNAISLIVIHTTEGSYPGSVGWLTRQGGDASCHYLIREDGGEITQIVKDWDTAWHAGNWPYNLRAIGIEASWASNGIDMGAQPSSGLYRTDANLTAFLCVKYAIPPDRAHIIGHGQIPPPNNHTDPGPKWNWTLFMAMVAEAYTYYKGGTPITPTVPATVPGTQFFPETGFGMGGGFYLYWQKYGGVRTFGFPITGEFKSRETGLTTQVVQRGVLEYHPENNLDNQVQGALIGSEWLERHKTTAM